MNKTKLITTLAIVILLVGAAAFIKHRYFPTVDEKYFQLDYQRLQNAPDGIMIFRPTKFEGSRRSGCFTAWPQRQQAGTPAMRILGRNVTIAQILPLAYQCQPSRLIMPPGDDPKRYDLLVTLPDNPAEHLQALLKKKTGYTAAWQDRETPVWFLKTRNNSALHTTTNDQGGINFKNNRLIFTRMPISTLASFLENGLKKPVQDKTGLTGNYDYSLAWDWRGVNVLNEDALKKSLADLGLGLDQDTDTLKMLVVKKAE